MKIRFPGLTSTTFYLKLRKTLEDDDDIIVLPDLIILLKKGLIKMKFYLQMHPLRKRNAVKSQILFKEIIKSCLISL